MKGLALLLLPSWQVANADSIRFEGWADAPIFVSPDPKSGLTDVCVLSSLEGVSAIFESPHPEKIQWSSFSNLGASFAEPIVEGVTIKGNTSIYSHLKSDTGYIVTDGDKNYYFWIIDYSKYPLKVDAVAASPNQDCEATIVDIKGIGEEIKYFSINGRKITLPRDIVVDFQTLKWNDEIKVFDIENSSKTLPYLSDEIYITPPVYTPTKFHLSGDIFLTTWGHEISEESEMFYPKSVDAETTAIQRKYSADGSDTSGENGDGILGGSAPADITFNAYVSDAVVHSEWQISDDPEFENVTYRFYQQDLDYTFTQEGTSYVRFIGSNSDGSCEKYGDVYTIEIGASDLKIPNAFSPNGDGINDVWRVVSQSLLDYKCTIFDRNGREVFHADRPDIGWDGKKNGKDVKPGVYFYVITATGSDGKRYKKSGDINILKQKKSGASASPVE